MVEIPKKWTITVMEQNLAKINHPLPEGKRDFKYDMRCLETWSLRLEI